MVSAGLMNSLHANILSAALSVKPAAIPVLPGEQMAMGMGPSITTITRETKPCFITVNRNTAYLPCEAAAVY